MLGTGFAVQRVPGGAAGAVRVPVGSGRPRADRASASVTVPASAADTKAGNGQLALFVDAGPAAGFHPGSFEAART